MSERLITEIEEKIYRSCHHDFGGMTQQEVAVELCMSRSTISRILKHIEKKAPQLFPILTPKQKQIRDLICNAGLTHQMIALDLAINEHTVDHIVEQLKKKGVCLPSPPKTKCYQTYMDAEIKQKF